MDIAFYSDILQSLAILVLALVQYKWIKDTIQVQSDIKLLSAYLHDSHTAVERMADLMMQQSNSSSSTPPTV